MKTICTLLIISACTFLPCEQAISQNCNYSSGGNGVSTALPSAITIDGNMADWAPYLNDPDNNSYDNTDGSDLDAPISDAGRDLVRFAFTESASNLYIYLERAGSTNNSVDIVFYVDINNNDIMDSKEPVYHINWSGSNGNVSVNVYNYNPSLLSLLLNTISLNLDGNNLMGSLSYRGNQGPGSSSGKGSANGKSVEVTIPFTQITRLGLLNNVIDQLAFGEDFKFHVSTINGNVSSIPGANSINDNFGGCLAAPAITLPVELVSFSALLNNDQADLKWTTSSEKDVNYFSIEKSLDGQNFTEAGVVFAVSNSSEMVNYNFADKNINTSTLGIIYYRLRSVDVDGKYEYSAIRMITIGNQNRQAISVQAYPNPVTSELCITIPASWQGKKVSYELISNNGQVARKSVTGSANQTETINLNSLAPGFYMIKVSCNGEMAQQKIIKR